MSGANQLGQGMGEVKFVSFSCCLPKRKNKFFTDDMKGALHEGAAVATGKEPGDRVTFQDIKNAWIEARDAAKSVGARLGEVNQQAQKAITFINDCLGTLIFSLQMLLVIEKSAEEGEEPSSEAIAFLEEALQKLQAIATTLNATKAIAQLAAEVKLPSKDNMLGAIADNAKLALDLNKKIREIHLTLADADMAQDGIKLEDLDKVDRAAKKMVVLYKVSQLSVGLTNAVDTAPVVADTTPVVTDTAPVVVEAPDTPRTAEKKKLALT